MDIDSYGLSPEQKGNLQSLAIYFPHAPTEDLLTCLRVHSFNFSSAKAHYEKVFTADTSILKKLVVAKDQRVSIEKKEKTDTELDNERKFEIDEEN